VNRDTNDWYRCVNGELFGVAVMHHDNGLELHNGWYGSQDSSNEMRAWTCTTVIKGRLTGCTTHLSTDPDVAMRQCHELMSILASPWVMPEVIVAGDFNLKYEPGKPHNVQDCALANYDRRSDGALQQVFFTRNIRWVRGKYETMRWTDHPLLYERFRV
jgi:endonuclease/exonuclease/phosphatase family metal-dependent hydrolase